MKRAAPIHSRTAKSFDNSTQETAGFGNDAYHVPTANEIAPPATTLPRVLEQTAATYSDRTALLYFGSRMTYAQLLEQVNRVAAGVQALGIDKGDRVALMMPNCPQFVISYFGALRAGAIVTGTNAIYTPREVTYQWNDAGAKLVIADRRCFPVIKAALPQLASVRQVVLSGMRQYYPRHFEQLCASLETQAGPAHTNRRRNARPKSATSLARHDWEDLLQISRIPGPDKSAPGDIACLQYTGGTTGTSKGAMLTHANLIANVGQFLRTIGERSDRQESVLVALPLFHSYAMLCAMITSAMIGGAMVLAPRFELRLVLNLIRKHHPTVIHGVPTMYVAFNGVPNLKRYGVQSLKLCTSGGAPLPLEVRQKFEALTGGKLVEGYGLSEASPVTHFNRPNGLIKPGSIGQPVPQTEVRIVDLETGTREMPVGEVGEIALRGPQVMKGYWNKPAETDQVLRDGWLFTGDIAKKDSDGYYYIVDRKKDMIIAGGYNIYPREVEEVLFEHPQIKEAAVIGVPDEYRGETVKAFVVLKDGAVVTAEEIIAFCRERMAPYKVPRQVVFRDSLPKSGVGKYLRRELRNL
jgi:long-chain acyl-CoA synthetase